MVADTVRFLVPEGRRVFLDAEHLFDGYQHDAETAPRVLAAGVEAGADAAVLCDTYGGQLSGWRGETVQEVLHRTGFRLGIHCQDGHQARPAGAAATANARLHQLGIRAPGATIALAGGLLAAAFSALVSWVLSRPEVAEAPTLVRALQDLAFTTGGPGHVVPLGLLVAGISVPGLLARLLPRWLSIAGLVIAALAELSTLTLLLDDASYLLPVARFTGLAWLIIAGFLLPRERERRNR